MMSRRELFDRARHQTSSLLRQYPGDFALQSVAKQLEYLIELISGIRSDSERLDDIIIGVLTAREIEVLDFSVAELLYKGTGEVESMKQEPRKIRP